MPSCCSSTHHSTLRNIFKVKTKRDEREQKVKREGERETSRTRRRIQRCGRSLLHGTSRPLRGSQDDLLPVALIQNVVVLQSVSVSEERGKRTRGGSGGQSKRWGRAGEREQR